MTMGYDGMMICSGWSAGIVKALSDEQARLVVLDLIGIKGLIDTKRA